MNRPPWTILFAASLTLGACRSAGPAPAPSAGKTADPDAPAAAIAAPKPTVAAPGETSAIGSPLPAASVPPQPPSPAVPRPYQDILKLKQSGASDEFLLNKIHSENVDYQLTTQEILELRAAGISQAVVEAMLRSGRSR